MNESVTETVLRECAPYISLLQAGCKPLVRGVSPADARQPHFQKDVWRDRRPKNMPLELHEAADRWFTKHFGVRYRSAGLFCTGSRQQAAQHGHICYVFPIEGFQFCWSARVNDLHQWAVRHDRLSLAPEQFVEELSRLEYQDWDLASATASSCEVMISCRSYHAVVAGDVNEEIEVFKRLKISPEFLS